MKKTIRNTLLIILAVIMLLSVTVVTPITANASTGGHTAAEAVAWANSQVGKALDYDGAYGAQCVDLIAYYYKYLGNTTPGGNACDYTKNALPSGWQRITNYSGFSPQAGDICVWGSSVKISASWTLTQYGHIGIVTSGNSSTFNSVEQNVSGQYTQTCSNRGTSYVTCWIRPDFATAVKSVANAWVKTSKTRLATGESNTITFGADNATSYNIRIDKDGSLWKYQEGVKSGLSYTFSDAGSYCVWIAGHNSSSYQDSSKVYFTVFKTLNFGNSFYAHITNVKTGKKITANNSDNVILSSKDNSDYQKWLFERNSDGTYRITNAARKKCLDVLNGDTANGTNIQVYAQNDSNAQKWYIVYNGSGYGIVPKCNTAAAMDIYGGASETTADGTNVQEYVWNATAAQIFSIDYISLKPSATSEYNGHRYEYYSNNTTWNQAYKYCEKLGGHLVTITSKEENDAVVKLTNGYSGRAWIGSNKNSTWYWINGEKFSYQPWSPGEPNNTNGIEDALVVYVSGDNVGKWNDDAVFNSNVEGFICEYDDIVNADDYSPITSVESGGYRYELYDYNVDWQTAEKICEKKGGTLATIYDESENDVIANLTKNGTKNEYWIGLSDIEDEGIWKWIDGNYAAYTNWLSGDPNNDFAIEEYIAINKDSEQWYDLKGYCYYYRSIGFICKIKTTYVKFDKSALTLAIGDSETLTARIYDSATTADGELTWSSSNQNVATVNRNGKITAINEGTAIITATLDNGNKDTCLVTVTPKITEATAISLNKTSLSLEVGNSETLTATISPSNATDKTITWTSSNITVATVENGKITAKAEGTAIITAKTINDKTVTCTVTVRKTVDENAPRIVVDSKTVKAGDKISVNVTMKNNPGIWGLDVKIKYDKSVLTLTNVSNGDVFSNAEWTQGDLSSDQYVLSYEASGFDNIAKNGTLATLEFTVNDKATVGTETRILVDYNTGDIINSSFEDINFDTVSGTIKISDFIYGDMSGDGLVNKKDSLLLKMYLANSKTEIDKNAADVYPDGIINKKDSLYLKQYLAGLNVKLGQ